MRIQRSDDDDVRDLVERGSSSWTSPSPFASQSRWAARAARRRVAHGARLVAAGVGFTVVVFGLTLVAAQQSPGGAAATVTHLVSHVFPGVPGTPGGVPGDSPSPPAPASPAAGAAVRPAAPVATARPAQTHNPAPSPWGREDDRRSTPAPSGSAVPSPNPSRSPDE